MIDAPGFREVDKYRDVSYVCFLQFDSVEKEDGAHAAGALRK